MVVLSDLHNSEFGAYNSELVDKARRRWPAFYLRIPVGHVEARLRTYDLDSPYPEELNRQAAPRTFPAWHTA